MEHAVEVRQCLLRSRAGSWQEEGGEEEGRKEEEEVTLIKSRDTYPLGEEQIETMSNCNVKYHPVWAKDLANLS